MSVRLNSVLLPAIPLVAMLTTLIPVAAHAQGDDAKHFGVGVSFAPSWKSHSDLLITIGLEAEDVGSFEGKEFTIGFVRGRTRGGDWGVSFVRKPFKDQSTVTRFQEADSCGSSCTFSLDGSTTTTFDGVYFRGVEVHWAPSFVTIANRVQIGLNIAGGIAVAEGTIQESSEYTYVETLQGRSTTTRESFDESTPAKEVFFSKLPLFKVEAQGAVILAPGLKLKISGGINNPGVGMRVTAVYLFGAN